MAVAAALGGASPNFDGLYAEVGRLAKKLSLASPRELNDPGVTLQITKPGNPPEVFDTYIRPFYGKEGSPIIYKLFYKDGNNVEIMVSDGQKVVAGANLFTLNGQTLNTGNVLALDPNNGRIVFNGTSTSNPYDPTNAGGVGTNVALGLMKLDAVTGLDVGLINDRISTVNLVIEALNKVLTVAIGNADTAINLRI
jgi:hypothetical protein